MSISECRDGSQDSKLLLHAYHVALPTENFLDPYFIFMYMHNNHCHQMTAHLQLNILLLLLSIYCKSTIYFRQRRKYIVDLQQIDYLTTQRDDTS